MASDSHRNEAASLARGKDVAMDERDSLSSTNAKRGVPTRRARLFPAVSPDRPPPAPSRLRFAALPLVFLSLMVAVAAKSPLIRFAVPIALMALAIGLRSRFGVQRSPRHRGVLLDGSRLFFQGETDPPRCVAALHDRFGLTLVKNPERDRLVAVWSSPDGLFYVGTSLSKATPKAFGPLFERAFTVLGDEAALQAIGPDGDVLELEPDDFSDLINAVEELDPACPRRLVLSDARGAPFTLDDRELVVGERKFDLEAPLEWRPFVFQEALGQCITVYQGTSIRQGGSEAILVSLLPPFAPLEVRDLSRLDRAILRDVRLTQASREDPPPRDARVAIDRLFVLPVRSALDTAPQANRRSTRARA